MPFRKRLLVFLASLLALAGLTALFSPWVLAHGLRFWLGWAARHDGLQVEIGKIEAPFLHPVTIDHLRITPAREAGREINLELTGLALDFNFHSRVFSQRARFLHALTVAQMSGSIRHGRAAGREKLDWHNLQRLLPDQFRFESIELEVTTAATAYTFRGLRLSASEIDAGRFFAQRISVSSPILRQTFSELRGATSWESDRLTIAGVSLARGLDLEVLTIDLSSLTKRRLGLDLHLDTYGGTLRASFQGRGGGQKFAIDLAGSAANLSLAQISTAAGLLEPLTGSVPAAKFTFRGNPGEFLDATASVWIELSDFAWRARRGDHLVFGATYYDRRLQVEQLYVQQRQNELTVNGELLWPKKRSDWAALPFRGQLSAAIPDANSFAQLFGAAAGDFSGALSARGEIDALDPAAHGQLTFRGDGVRFRTVALDSLGGKLQLRGSEAELENLEVRHENDFLRAHGSANLRAPHAYSARLTGAINNLAEYAPLLPQNWRAGAVGGGMTFDWTGDGTASAHSGTVQFFAHGLQLPVAPLRAPLDVTLEGTYSPQDIFFRTFKLADERVSLGGFLMLGPNFVELQALELTLDGTPRASGTLFLPLGVDRWRKTGSLFEAFDEHQKFDVDLTVDHLDLAHFVRALGESPPVSGVLSGKVAAYGPLASLQLTTNWQLQNLGEGPTPNDITFDLRCDQGRAEANLRATFGVSAPLTAQASLPLRLQKPRLRDGGLLDSSAPFSLAIACPGLFLAMLPDNLRPFGATSGLITGQINYSKTLADPKIDGEAQLLDLKIVPPAPWPLLTKLDAAVRFEKHAAVLPWFRLTADGFPLAGRASLTTHFPAFALTLWPSAEEIALTALPESGAQASVVRLLETGIAGSAPRLEEARVRGKIGTPAFSLTIDSTTGTQTTLFFDPAAATTAGPLLLNVAAPAL